MRRSALVVLALCACDPQPAVLARRTGARFVDGAAAGDVAASVREEALRARSEGGRVLVYVGAAWCEPCRYFHQAVASHAIDREFPGLTLVAFDLDRDGARLTAAGYVSERIPLLAVPAPDGRASGRQMDGSIHGPGAVDEMLPRLHALLDAR